MTLLSIFFLLAACLPAPQTQATVALTVTLTPTVIPTLTPIPTATISPQVTALQEEIREFIPAETVVFSENLANYELKLAPDADLKAIYWDIAVVQLGNATSNSKGMEKNRKVYEEIIKDFPQWEGIGSGSDYKERVAFMKEFLKRTGGTMNVQNHNFEKFQADFNQPIKFEVVQVEALSSKSTNFLGLSGDNPYGRGGGGLMYVDSKGRITYKVEIVKSALDAAMSDKRYIYKTHNWTAGGLISDIFRQLIVQTSFKDKDSNNHQYQLYTKGADPKNSRYYVDVYWTFIK